MRRTTTLFLLLASASFASACQPDYSSIDIAVLSSPATSVDIRSTSIEIPVGAAVLIRAIPRSSSTTSYDTETQVELDTADNDIFDARSTDKSFQFVLIGVAPGETCMEVDIDGENVECIEVEVTAPF